MSPSPHNQAGRRLRAWTGTEPLPTGAPVLLEASAGTGKTWQIAQLVTRLVADEGLAIDRILVITFTRAATSELRDRVRRRLAAARDALGEPTAPAGDPLLAALWADPDTRVQKRDRLQQALAGFDRAAISTIHGFSQRTLEQFAFESGQESDLEVLADADAVIDERVADTLATAFAGADMSEAGVLESLGLDVETLTTLTHAVSGAVEPVLIPSASAFSDLPARPLDIARAWLELIRNERAWWISPPGQDVKAALTTAHKARNGRKWGPATATKAFAAYQRWLELDGIGAIDATGAQEAYLTRQKLDDAWKDGPQAHGGFGGYAFFDRYEALQAALHRLGTALRVRFAATARTHVAEELERRGQLTYNAMLTRLAERVQSQGPNGALCEALRGRYDAALVDEFQDTDGAQWPVLQAVFHHPDKRLLLIGDPKQAIYGFRDADLHVYLAAASTASHFTMRTNYRTDDALIRALNGAWSEGSGAFGLANLDYLEVTAQHQEPRVTLPALPALPDRPRAAFELRWADGRALGAETGHISNKGAAESLVAALCARETRLLLANPEPFFAADPTRAARRLRPGDIAVLVRNHRQASLVRAALRRLGIPAVSAVKGSVFVSPPADWLALWLDALGAPGRDGPARALYTSPLVGRSVEALAEALAQESHEAWTDWMDEVAKTANLWPRRGFIGAFSHTLASQNTLARLLAAPFGERHATDLRHLMELCHAEERRSRLGPVGLADWLRRMRHLKEGSAESEAAIRLESDDDAVRLVTIHSSKGLEYPVVLLPFGWADSGPRTGAVGLKMHRPMASKTGPAQPVVCLDLHPDGSPERQESVQLAIAEAAQENARLLYVAMTRAAHHLVVWFVPGGKANKTVDASALGRLLFRPRDAAGRPTGPPLEVGAEAFEDTLAPCLEAMAQGMHGAFGWSVEEGPEDTVAPLAWDGPDRRHLQTRPWHTRSMVGAFQVASYTSLVAGRQSESPEPTRPDELITTRGIHDRSAMETDGGGVTLPPADPPAALPEPNANPDASALPLAEMWGGTVIGTWVHAVFEHLDFQTGGARDGRSAQELVSTLGAGMGVPRADQHTALLQALPSILATPLGQGQGDPLAGLSLADIKPGDRLDELGFDLRLGAGTRWRQPGTASGQPADAAQHDGRLSDHSLRQALAPVAGQDTAAGRWAAGLLARSRGGEPLAVLPRIAGILTGFVDLVFRVRIPAAAETGHPYRYFIADYKTNRIRSRQTPGPTTAAHYTAPWMAWEMAHHGYHLQALLYQVALHRLLAYRLGDTYDPARHLGGHLYLFVRGMTGPDCQQPDGAVRGVFRDRWPTATVCGVSEALDGRALKPTKKLPEVPA